MMSIIREPHNGVWYYADESNNLINFRGRRYLLRIWRTKKFDAKYMADGYRYSGYLAVVKKIPFRRGGMFAKGKGKKTIYCYGVYTSSGPVK